MSLLQIFVVSLVAFFLFKLVGPMIFKLLGSTLGAIANMTVINALVFGTIFVVVYEINRRAKLLDNVEKLLKLQ